MSLFGCFLGIQIVRIKQDIVVKRRGNSTFFQNNLSLCYRDILKAVAYKS